MEQIEGRRTGRAQDEDVALPHWTVPIKEINVAVARYYHIEPEELQAHGHHGGVAKVAAVELACRLSGLTQRAIGAHYGHISSSGVCAIHRKVGRDPEVVSVVEVLAGKLIGKRRRK